MDLRPVIDFCPGNVPVCADATKRIDPFESSSRLDHNVGVVLSGDEFSSRWWLIGGASSACWTMSGGREPARLTVSVAPDDVKLGDASLSRIANCVNE